MEPVNANDVEWVATESEQMRFRRKKLGAAGGGERIGCSLYELDSGDAAWPYHYHAANEEALYVLAGEGLLRTASGEHAIEAGDYAAFPTGADGGHRVVNDSAGALRYLVVSTMAEPEVVRYPESEGVGVMVGGAPGATEREFEAWFTEGDARSYEDATSADGGG
ncbi:cupin domain-containing protein [Halarchaeum sp. CBA1220]|uniref:cupin domain-containing protein n=1 Tax=Halarchaeum sp. CBA1220 TaxID=1853682 RepID=UPI000F3A8E57|nr:cupin domain-containing protein [Halarchaeum sp. CBA1220]QLC33321.1 cupin domain-containing protein [Halarchaeum sp. CBA1220]